MNVADDDRILCKTLTAA